MAASSVRSPGNRTKPIAPAQLVMTHFAVTLVVIGLAAGAVAVGFGADPAPTLLRFVLGIAAGAGGLFAAAGHLLRSDDTARDLGWPVGTPWQREVGFADLSFGVISLIAAFSRVRAVWLVVVVAMAVFMLGAAAGHLLHHRRLRARGEDASSLGTASILGDVALPLTLIVLFVLT
ncbi:MAG: hypothetical protein JO037_26280 [Actinobacteria bacterium]|nr:hypothetical protein [Actinomycetota bacterium]